MGLERTWRLSLCTSGFRVRKEGSYHFLADFCLREGGPRLREGGPRSQNLTTCLEVSRRRVDKSETIWLMSGDGSLSRASRSWICRRKWGELKRRRRSSVASGDQSNLRRGERHKYG